jgi:hypothetical protein
LGNKYCAEATLQAGAKSYALRYDWNSAVEYETAAGRPIFHALVDLERGEMSATSMRAMLWAGLRARHPKVTIERCGRLIARAGRLEVFRVMGVALRFYYPELLGDPPDPPKPAPAA